MIAFIPHFNPDAFSLQDEPYFATFVDYLSENDELVCSVLTAIQFKDREICNLIKRMSDNGLVEMTPREKDLESFSLCLTEKGRGLACHLANGRGMITNLIPGLFEGE